jgi:hypothetical protein
MRTLALRQQARSFACLVATIAASRSRRVRYTIGRLMLIVAASAVAMAWVPWPIGLALGSFALLGLALAKLGARPIEVLVVLAIVMVATYLSLLAMTEGRPGPGSAPAAKAIFKGLGPARPGPRGVR